MRPYRLHIFVCQGKRCDARGSEEVLEELKALIKGRFDDVRVSRSGCIKVCKETETEGEYSPVVAVYPRGVWYRNVAKADVGEIVERHVKKGEVVDRLLHFDANFLRDFPEKQQS